ncbi:protein MCM10 homolog isoform X2 [Orussus abietinus]|nr:protein MCM10 homolog isoform X2 [Orussus abietinus]
MNNNDNIDQATLSIDNAQKLMILGNSKDMGTCKSVKKSGEPCTAIVNTHLCQYCTYHVQKEYSKCSRRAELQATGNGQKFSALNRLKNNNFPNKSNSLGSPVLNIAAAKKTRELREKDNARLALLMGEKMEKSETKHSGENKGLVQSNDLKKIQESRGWMKNTLMSNQSVTPTDSSMAGNILNKDTKKINLQLLQRSNAIIKSLKSNAAVKPISSPNNSIDFSEPITKKNINKAKLNALKWVQQHGSIKQANPNKIRPSEEDKTKLQTKRQRSDEDAVNDVKAKKAKSELDNFKKLMETTSAHVDLIERSNDENAEKYFNKLEVKEKMEEKMMSTFKVECKAVMCSICNYTALSSSDLCKEQGHPITVIKAVKRFFKCSDCGNRTISLDRMPNRSCKKCGSSSWSKAAMMNEKKVGLPGAKLSIRGDEETFINSGTNDANLDLLVPDTSS